MVIYILEHHLSFLGEPDSHLAGPARPTAGSQVL